MIVGVAALLAAGPDRLAAATAPLTTAVRAAGAGGLAPVVRVGGAPAAVHPRFQVPHHAQIALAVVVWSWWPRSTCAGGSASRRSAC